MAEQRLLAVSPNLPCAMDRQEWSLDDYHIRQTLYSGYAAQVFTATCKYSGMEVVLKIYQDVDKAPDVAQHEMYREVAIQSGLQHPNVVHLFGAFEEGDTLVLVQEYVPNGDLLALMNSHGGRVDEATVVKVVLRPLLGALMYLHRWGIIHRDVKPENVLFAADGTIKLADFGLAINMVEERPVSRVGTLDYMAPEVLRCPIKQSMAMAPGPNTPARYGFATDVWAVGIVTYELLTGLPPYASDCRYQAETRICAALPPLFPHSVSPMARDFILRTLAPQPGDRPTIRQLLEHPWIVNPDACAAHCRAQLHRGLMSLPNAMPSLHAGNTASYSHIAGLQHITGVQHGHGHSMSAPHPTFATYGDAPSAPEPQALSSAPTLPYIAAPCQGQSAKAAAAAGSGPKSHALAPEALCQQQPSTALQRTQEANTHGGAPSTSDPVSTTPAAAMGVSSGPAASIEHQLRVMQQQQLLDLSKLPLEQIQSMIQKLQQAMQLAVVQQRCEVAGVSVDVGAGAAEAGAGPQTAPQVAAGAAGASDAAGVDVSMDDVRMADAGVPYAMVSLQPGVEADACSSCVHSSCNSPVVPPHIVEGLRAGIATAQQGQPPPQQQVLGLGMSSMTPFAAGASPASGHSPHQPPASAPYTAATGTTPADTASCTSAATAYGSPYGSRRTTAEAPLAVPACCQPQHHLVHPVATLVACPAAKEALALGLELGRVEAHCVPMVSVVPVPAGPLGRSSGGGIPEGDGLVYVSIGSSRKVAADAGCDAAGLGMDLGSTRLGMAAWSKGTSA